MRFRGEHNQRVDDKCRLSIPSAFRQLLETHGDPRLVLVKALRTRCLQAFTVPEWEAREDLLMKLPASDPVVQNILRFQVASAQMVEPDSHGRIVLAPALRTYAGIAAQTDAVVIGQVQRFEVWSGEAWTAEQNRIVETMSDWDQRIAALGL